MDNKRKILDATKKQHKERCSRISKGSSQMRPRRNLPQPNHHKIPTRISMMLNQKSRFMNLVIF